MLLLCLQVTAAHTCYLVAEANFEPYSDSARLCLVGADHWKCPRTFASPEAIQVTDMWSSDMSSWYLSCLGFNASSGFACVHLPSTVGLADQVKICGYWNKRTTDVTEGAS